MALAYRHLTAEQKAAVDADVQRRTAPPAAPNDALVAAWEADHYAHSLLLAAATDEAEQEQHRAAIKTLEQAVHAARRERPAAPPPDAVTR